MEEAQLPEDRRPKDLPHHNKEAHLASDTPGVTIRVDYDPCINFAMQQNAVPVVKLLQVVNTAKSDLHDMLIRLWIESDLSTPWERRISHIPSGGTYNFESVDLLLNPVVLAGQTERSASRLRAEIFKKGELIAQEAYPVEVLAYNEWGGLRSLPEAIAAFVMPNHPSIEQVLIGAREHLRAKTGDPSLSGYQRLQRVPAMLDAIYTALQEIGISYINPPASFEDKGQKIRTPDQILQSRMGTCLDLALLLAACFEQVGLHPLIFLIDGHAFTGVWLKEESFAEAVVDDAARLRKRIDLGEMFALEATAITTPTPTTFGASVRLGRGHLEEDMHFHCAIDIKAARRMCIRPIPIRVLDGTLKVVEMRGPLEAPPKESASRVPEADRSLHVDFPSDDHGAGSGTEEKLTGNQRIERWKRKLLDLSLRNRLINYRDSKTTLPLLCPDLGGLENTLADGKSFSIHPRPALLEAEDPRSLEIHLARTGEDALGGYLLSELKAKRMRSSLLPKELERRLTEIYRSARLSIEESGAGTLYLALGIVTWYESPVSAQERRAPILLLPLHMERRSMREGFAIRLADEDPRINTTLVEKLKAEFAVRTDGLTDLPEDGHGLDVGKIFRNFRRAIKHMDRWDVKEEAHIGIFSFTKFLMWTDLQERSHHLLQNPVVKHLTEKPEEAFDPGGAFPSPHELDKKRLPADTFCPLDADSSQLCAIYAGQEGRSFVLEGPPGTGKSQTITNLIAQCLASGKRVLFVSEKMAALNVVYQRLERVGLGPFCLELHSNKANKKDILRQLGKSAEIVATHTPLEWNEIAYRLQTLKADLNCYAETAHHPQATGESVFQAISRLVSLRDAPKLPFRRQENQHTFSREQFRALRDLAEELRSAGTALESLHSHPLRAVGLADWRSTLADEVESAAREFMGASEAYERCALESIQALGLEPGDGAGLTKALLDRLDTGAELLLSAPMLCAPILTQSGWKELRERLSGWIARGRERDEARVKLLERYDPELLELDCESVLERLQRSFQRRFPFAWLDRRAVRKALKRTVVEGKLPSGMELVEDLKQAVWLRAERTALSDTGNESAQLFGSAWNDGEADWSSLDSLLEWVGRFRALLLAFADPGPSSYGKVRDRLIALVCDERELLDPQAPLGRKLAAYRSQAVGFKDRWHRLSTLLQIDPNLFDEPEAVAEGYIQRLRAQARLWLEHRSDLRDWCHWRAVRSQALAQEGLAAFIDACERGDLTLRDLPQALDRSVTEWWLNGIIDSNEPLRRFNRVDHERKIGLFKDLDLRHMQLCRQVLHARLAAQIPSLTQSVCESSEVGVFQREQMRSRGHMPIRKLFTRIPNLLARLKPCFLMSPLSVAQYLDVTFPAFDTVIFDEASQMPVWDAIGAIARGRELIVVGDSRQLPPTSFFMKMDEEEEETPDESDIQDLESILDECIASRLPRLYLQWHYRSRHESLITFSNHHYYENRLLTFPSSVRETPGLGVSLRYLADGIYDRGGSRTNRAEAEGIVAEIIERLRNGRQESIGVVTFSLVQQQLVEDLLDEARRKYPEIDPWFTDAVEEPVLVKNLENVQGDERDVILLSVCYGKDKTGRPSVNFGPLNRVGGERRLNVAITRSRKQVVVFSSIRGDQIDLSRTNALGVKHLNTFLEYAEFGPKAIVEATSLSPEADFDSPFERDVHHQLTVKGYEVDLQVGCSGYRIDLAVKDPAHPGRYLIGIECDGASYHSSRCARDRDRLRQMVLEGLGWRLHRIWSTDWWLNPKREMDRMESAIVEAKNRSRSDIQAAPGHHEEISSNEGITPLDSLSDFTPVSAAENPTAPLSFAAAPQSTMMLTSQAAPLPSNLRPYQVAPEALVCGGPEDFYTSAMMVVIQKRLTEILAAEAPMHLDLAARRIIGCFQIGKVTRRVRERLKEMIAQMPLQGRPTIHGDFIWAHGQSPLHYEIFRVPEPLDPTSRKVEEIPPEEVANAAGSILRQQLALPLDDLARETARLFGIQRMGNQVVARMQEGIAVLRNRESCMVADGIISLPRGQL